MADPLRKDTAGAEPSEILGRAIIALAVLSAICSITLTYHSFVRCPFSDMWRVVDDIALGLKPWGLAWLWSQHNEHRIAIPRLLAWFDWKAFGGYGISMLFATYLCQFLQWGAIAIAVERWTALPKPLKRMPQGLFALCLFHPLQAENLILPFQVSFVLPFALATVTFLVIAFRDHTGPRIAVWVGVFAPAVAALNLAAGLSIWPVALLLAGMRRLPLRPWFVLFCAGVGFSGLYLIGYRTPALHSSPLDSVQHPLAVLAYAMAYLQSPFHSPFTPHWQAPVITGLSMLFLLFAFTRAMRGRDATTSFEWFCLAECGFVIGVALLTALGRVRFSEAFSPISRYHTPAMIYWASVLSLAAVQLGPHRRSRGVIWSLAVPILVWTAVLPLLFLRTADFSAGRAEACQTILRNPNNARAAKVLDPPDPAAVALGAEFLERKWKR